MSVAVSFIVDGAAQVLHKWPAVPRPGDVVTLGHGTPTAHDVQVQSVRWRNDVTGECAVDVECTRIREPKRARKK